MRRVLPLLIAVCLALAALSAHAAGKARNPAKPRVHVVQRGQTLGMIAKRYHVSVDALRRANDIHRSKDLKPKQRLVVPAPSDKDGSRARALRHAGYAEPQTRPAAVETSPKVKPGAPVTYARKPRHPGYVMLRSTVGAWRGYAVHKGKVSKAAVHNVTRVLASWRTQQKLAIDERLIRMIATVSDHFGGRAIRVVSGFRPYRPTQYTPHSRHNLGHAVDFTIPGVPNTALRDFCRTLPNVGCGYYPNSSFVHMDVREMSAYWVDFAGPGEAPRYATAKGVNPGRAESEAAEREHEPEHATPASEPAAGSGQGDSDGHANAEGSSKTHAEHAESGGDT